MSGRIASAFGSVWPMRSRIVRNGVIAAGAIGVLLACVMVAAPFLIEGEAAKTAIEKRLTELTGGEFHYEALQFHVWPWPTAELRGIAFGVPPLVEGTAERARLRFALLPLLKGDLRISRMRLERPVAVVRIAGFETASMGDDPVATYRNAVAPTLAWLALHADGLELSIRDGAVELYYDGESSLKLDSLALDGQVSDDAVEAKVAARAAVVETGAREREDRDRVPRRQSGAHVRRSRRRARARRAPRRVGRAPASCGDGCDAFRADRRPAVGDGEPLRLDAGGLRSPAALRESIWAPRGRG
jgi:hypothetical protein